MAWRAACMNRLYMAVLAAAPTVWSRRVLAAVLRLLRRGSTRALGPPFAASSLASGSEAADTAAVVGARWYAGKVLSRKSCQKEVAEAWKSREKRAYWKTGM
ncbi:hypothetical protein CHGG_06261 [Chaetomium globosum CBS 148.51]|uniref:Uncharacterized protein n=1 Tax=Chaetomium globosum (strain ATCC 6205 / CBS 148.51 / DSM 1962 / NBRC 6347 / NRRL 1970) TaxID=306901 RepID=Q2H504_CHAGB|nr:uncharacterized protein CHGG_06261 [Chaetomium globosum CBS 148.51]EAQ89642.1 hypothetical protein CHGG_06261 [Chaetomium globosum CBS 148.51]